ncbi:MAG: hypothetical protein R3A52_27935 [Polyangiales bacterium]
MTAVFATLSPDRGALRDAPTLRPGDPLSSVGLWCALPEGEHAVSLAVRGDAITEGVVAPIGAKVRRATERSARDDLWSGAGLRWVDGWMRGVALPVAVKGEGLARVCVAELTGVAGREGRGSLTLALTVDGEALVTRAVDLTVTRATERWWCLREGWTLPKGASAERLSRRVDALARVFARRGVGSMELLAARRQGGALRATVAVEDGGVRGAAWSRALAWAARGELATLGVEDREGGAVLRARWPLRGSGELALAASVRGERPAEGWVESAGPGWAEEASAPSHAGVPPVRELL